MASIHPSAKLAALALLAWAWLDAAGAARGATAEQAATSLGLQAAAEAMEAAKEGASHDSDAATVNAMRAAADLARAGIELYAIAKGVPQGPHIGLGGSKCDDSDKGTKNESNDDGGDGGDGDSKPSKFSSVLSALSTGKQLVQLLG